MSRKKIYNKNAREKALLEESYGQVHNEWVAQVAGLAGKGLKALGGAAAQGAKQGAKDAAMGKAKQVGGQVGAAAVNKVAGKFGGQQPVPPAEDEGAVDVELESWWEYDPHDVVVKVYHGALHAMPPGEGTPEYEANSEKIFTWLKGKYPKPDYNIDDVKFRERTSADATEWALRQDEDAEEHEMEFDERGFAKNTKAGKEDEDEEVVSEKIYNKNAKEKALLEEAYSSVYSEGQFWGRDDLVKKYKEKEKGHRKFTGPKGTTRSSIPPGKEFKKDIDDLLAKGYTENEDEDAESREERADVDKYEYEQGKEAGERDGHAKGVKMAIEALGMFKDELHVDGHGEDINVNELADAHDQLSRALHWLLDETDVEYITGGRATQKAEAEVDFKPAYGEY